MQRPLDELLAMLDGVLDADPARARAAAAARAAAEVLAPTLPLVHRTGKPQKSGAPTGIGPLLASGALRASDEGAKVTGDPQKAAERARKQRIQEQVGWRSKVCFFLGYPLYHLGSAVLVFRAAALDRRRVTFTPFDTGGLIGGRICPPAGVTDELGTAAVLAAHVGGGQDLVPFATAFLVCHLREPSDWMSRAPSGEPDFPQYHGLVGREPGRHSWIIEVQCHEDVPLMEREEDMELLILDRARLVRDVPAHLQKKTVVCEPAEGEDFRSAAARHILERMRKGRG